ncbi:uncharacterized protein Tco025E_04065 [Trypanosoma conorhini]|uniref:Uncharacterized protein n=1 Tax=Trypanosoma conorhini TaxID=83891 RepID=A0A422PQ04_9TRYP|nr:uncharacterized protein Tco025E_04065 [Trypanosoma conorhini]RNF19826.1 hypothetical protein Tco025E_04065 [Trypanosoma conorhini]
MGAGRWGGILQRKLLAALRVRAPLLPEKPIPTSSPSNAKAAAAPSTSRQWNTSANVARTPYGEQINHYIQDLEAHFKNSGEAVLSAQQSVERFLYLQAKSREEHRREYLLTFLPLVFILLLFMREQINRSCAEQTQLALREHADKCSSLKRVVL